MAASDVDATGPCGRKIGNARRAPYRRTRRRRAQRRRRRWRRRRRSRNSYVIHRVASVRMCVVPSRPAVGSGRRACGRPLASHPIDGYGWVVVVCRYSERRGAVSSWSLARALYHITAAAGSHGPRRLLTRRFACSPRSRADPADRHGSNLPASLS